MSGVLRLGNTGAGTGRSTLEASASNDQTFTLPSAGGTLLTSNTSIPGGTITLDGATINITNGDLNVDSGTLFVDESTNRVGIGTTTPSRRLSIIDRGTPIALSIGENDAATTEAGLEIISRNTANTSGYTFQLAVDADEAATTFDFGGLERMRIDSVGRVAINTTTIADTATALVIKNGATASEHTMLDIVCDTNESARVRFSEDGTTFPGEIRYNTLGHDLLVTVNASERLRINSDGSIEVGTGTEATNAGTPANSITLYVGATNEDYASVGGQYNRSNLFNQSQIRFGVEDNPNGRGFLGFATGTNSTTEQARIDSQGRLLIGSTTATGVTRLGQTLAVVNTNQYGGIALSQFAGTTATEGPIIDLNRSRATTKTIGTPVEPFDRLGSLVFRGDNGTEFTDAAYILGEVDGTFSSTTLPGRLRFYTGDDTNAPYQRLVIDAEGRLLHTPTLGAFNDIYARYYTETPSSGDQYVIGAFRNGAFSTSIKFTTQDGGVLGDRLLIGQGGMISYLSGSGWENQILYTRNGAGTSRSYIIGRYGATAIDSSAGTIGTISYQVFTNGDVVNTNNSYGPISSDRRLKTDIEDVTSQWEDIKNIRLTKFRYRDNPEGPLHIGPIAQELQEVCPGLITKREANEDDIKNSDGEIKEGDDVLSYKASILTLKAVKALQEAMARIEALESEVSKLRSN